MSMKDDIKAFIAAQGKDKISFSGSVHPKDGAIAIELDATNNAAFTLKLELDCKLPGDLESAAEMAVRMGNSLVSSSPSGP
jgi:hypothetical protein